MKQRERLRENEKRGKFTFLGERRTRKKKLSTMSRGPALSAALGGGAALLALVLAALVVFPLDKDVIVAPLARDLRKTPASAPIDAKGYKRETVLFPLLGGDE
jgi:hypothetical protein